MRFLMTSCRLAILLISARTPANAFQSELWERLSDKTDLQHLKEPFVFLAPTSTSGSYLFRDAETREAHGAANL